MFRASRGGWDDAVIQGIEPPTSDCKVASLTGVLLQHCITKCSARRSAVRGDFRASDRVRRRVVVADLFRKAHDGRAPGAVPGSSQLSAQ